MPECWFLFVCMSMCTCKFILCYFTAPLQNYLLLFRYENNENIWYGVVNFLVELFVLSNADNENYQDDRTFLSSHIFLLKETELQKFFFWYLTIQNTQINEFITYINWSLHLNKTNRFRKGKYSSTVTSMKE